MIRQALLFLHLSSVIVWVGGMVFAYFCLRPAAAQVLEPPQRLPLFVAAFGHFFRLVAIAAVLILLSGFTMLLQTGFARAPVGWNVMMLLGLVMVGVFGHINHGLYPKLRRHSAAAEWPAAAGVLNRIRQLVGLNLVLAVCTIAAALSAR
ncbi:MAG TPA: CopD family protein [Burkholderiaceae bacterium]|jgi:uncharacterized membrane protein